MAVLAGGVNASRLRRGITRVSNVRASRTPKTAIATSPATRDTALLTPDATPACRLSTALMTVVVNGATVTAIPNARTITAGQNVVQHEPPMKGRANNAKPSAAMMGPTVSGRRLPTRATRPPDHRDSANMMMGKGRIAAPADVAAYPRTWMRSSGSRNNTSASAA